VQQLRLGRETGVGSRKMWCVLAATFAIGCGDVTERTQLTPSNLKRDLDVLARARIYFGHQSVGNNVLDGLAALATKEGVDLRILEAPADDGRPGIIHARVGQNRAPESKCDAFARFLTSRTAVRWDAALLKFCYADLGENGERNPSKAFQSYKTTVTALRAARPDVLLVHATVPLKSEGLGKRNAIRKLFGLGTSNDNDNTIRNEFNDLLRAEYARDPIFDVASAESTRPDGSRSGFRTNGRFIFTMAREFTYDEGHLTEAGRQWVAREFARSLATALRERSSQTTRTSETP
jgi:hypothetical protein